jgi:flagellar protein FliS
MAALTNPYNNYVNSKVNTTSKGNLLIMVYDSAIRNIKEAQVQMVEKDFSKKGLAIDTAYKAVSELLFSLNFEVGGEIAKNLSSIYNFILRQITASNISNDPTKLDAPLKILSDFKQTWLEVIKIENGKKLSQQNLNNF